MLVPHIGTGYLFAELTQLDFKMPIVLAVADNRNVRGGLPGVRGTRQPPRSVRLADRMTKK